MMKSYGYCDSCATNVLGFVASIFARETPRAGLTMTFSASERSHAGDRGGAEDPET
jgi:hypothetical protein